MNKQVLSFYIPLTLGECVKVLRMRKKWSRNELAKRAGVQESVVGFMECDDFENVTIGNVSDVAEALGFWLQIQPFMPKEKNDNGEKTDSD